MGHTTKLILGKNDLQSVNPSLATEWHPTKNGELLPSMVTAHSKKKVWWLGKCGHEWPAEIDSRAIGRGCPYCSGRLVLEGFNDLATKAPNGEILPSHIPATYSKDKYYWKCKSCGYSWPASLGERIRGSGCPACAGKVIIPGINDLATTHKDLAAEWHPTRNGSITPQMVSKGSDDKIWWKCPKCGYEWQAKIKKRVAGSGCEKCAHEEWGQKQYKAVYQFALTGEYITSFPTARIAAEQLGISRGAIQSVCQGTGKNKTAGGYIWSYEKDGFLKETTLTSKSNKTKCVLQYSTDQQFIKKFQNIKEAASEVGISEVSIRHACNGTAGRKTAGGFIWRYAIE